MLFLVATPIGNLQDLTYRAVECLKSCDYILCEDTRHSLILLKHYDISKPLKSHHKFNEKSECDSIIEDLLAGKNICLISDAGTPAISDPGSILVALCHENSIPVTSLPGACSLIVALTASGLSTERFQFVGFLPKPQQELKKLLIELLNYPGTTACFESPHRLLETLQILHTLDPKRPLAIGRELTKKFEEVIQGTAESFIEKWASIPLKGEIVLMISPNLSSLNEQWKELSPREHVELIIATYGITKKEAIKLASEQRGVPKRQLYNLLESVAKNVEIKK